MWYFQHNCQGMKIFMLENNLKWIISSWILSELWYTIDKLMWYTQVYTQTIVKLYNTIYGKTLQCDNFHRFSQFFSLICKPSLANCLKQLYDLVDWQYESTSMLSWKLSCEQPFALLTVKVFDSKTLPVMPCIQSRLKF